MIIITNNLEFCRPGPLQLLCGAGNFGKIRSSCGEHEF